MTMTIQQCGTCGTVIYPARSLCRSCLSDSLTEIDGPSRGVLLAVTTLHHSLAPEYFTVLPFRIGVVHLDGGPRLVALLADGLMAGMRVSVGMGRNAMGAPAWLATSENPPVKKASSEDCSKFTPAKDGALRQPIIARPSEE